MSRGLPYHAPLLAHIEHRLFCALAAALTMTPAPTQGDLAYQVHHQVVISMTNSQPAPPRLQVKSASSCRVASSEAAWVSQRTTPQMPCPTCLSLPCRPSGQGSGAVAGAQSARLQVSVVSGRCFNYWTALGWHFSLHHAHSSMMRHLLQTPLLTTGAHSPPALCAKRSGASFSWVKLAACIHPTKACPDSDGVTDTVPECCWSGLASHARALLGSPCKKTSRACRWLVA